MDFAYLKLLIEVLLKLFKYVQSYIKIIRIIIALLSDTLLFVNTALF